MSSILLLLHRLCLHRLRRPGLRCLCHPGTASLTSPRPALLTLPHPALLTSPHVAYITPHRSHHPTLLTLPRPASPAMPPACMHLSSCIILALSCSPPVLYLSCCITPACVTHRLLHRTSPPASHLTSCITPCLLVSPQPNQSIHQQLLHLRRPAIAGSLGAGADR